MSIDPEWMDDVDRSDVDWEATARDLAAQLGGGRMKIIDHWASIDPGGVHVGLALWNGDEMVECFETTPQRVFRELSVHLVNHLVIEEFRLYPSHTKTLTGSTMETSQLIGALTWWASQDRIAVYMQPASIKVPTKSYMRKHQIDLVTGEGDHAQDAQVHGIHWLIRGQGKPPSGSDLFGGRYL